LEKKPKKIKQTNLEARIFLFPVNLSSSNKLSIFATKFGYKQNIMKVATFEGPSVFWATKATEISYGILMKSVTSVF